jgi:hypothetical protein
VTPVQLTTVSGRSKFALPIRPIWGMSVPIV